MLRVADQRRVVQCWTCSSRIGLLGFQCRCGYKFCAFHRCVAVVVCFPLFAHTLSLGKRSYAEDHNCPVDYKQLDRKKLVILNPRVETTKVRAQQRRNLVPHPTCSQVKKI